MKCIEAGIRKGLKTQPEGKIIFADFLGLKENASLLSSDLATLFTGRYIKIHVFPFSFAVTMLMRKDTAKLFDDNYIIKGGLD